MEPVNRRHEKQEKMFALIRRYFSGNLSQRQFCESQSVPYSTFCWWLRKYRSSQTEPTKEKTFQKFIPIQLPSTDSRIGSQNSCIIEYPNGVTLRLTGNLEPGFLAGLIGIPLS